MTTRRIRRTRPARSIHRPVRRTFARRAATVWPGLPTQKQVLDAMNEAKANGDDKTVRIGEMLLDNLYDVENLSSQVLSDIDAVVRNYQSAIPYFQGGQGSSDVDQVQRASKIAKNGEKFYESYHRAMSLAKTIDLGD